MKTKLRPIKSSKLSDKSSNKNNNELFKTEKTPKHSHLLLLDDFLEVK